MRITTQNLRKSFGGTTVIAGVSLVVEEGEMFFLLGPSGCGKTTLLRMIAGFTESDSGEIFFDGQRVNGLPPEARQTPMVFQSYALWPHLSVFENVAYGLRVKKMPEREIRRRVGEALEATRMGDYAARAPNQLSGGQQQRVAISRALAVDPPALLFDEPLSNLDAKLRLEMRDELREIHRRRPFTAIYVTHDQEEAMTLATRIAVMERGTVRQVGSPREIYTKPGDRFVAEFMGAMNWISGVVSADGKVATPWGEAFPGYRHPSLKPGDPALLGFRPAALRLEGSAGEGWEFEMRVASAQYGGPTQRLRMRTADGLEIQWIESNPRQARAPGEAVRLAVAASDAVALPD
ncbi:MAG: ABC transporter ATP-binding protein [Verrucomicrobiae bacterium]|nr:ABC transporter ATP-binding protein [Verrucomicrobiae bacterium]